MRLKKGILIAKPLKLCYDISKDIFGANKMENKIAVLAVIVEDAEQAESVNSILHGFRDYVVGRMGIPYRERGVNVISVVLDAPQNVISSLSGKIGMLNGVSSKVLTAK